VRQSASKAWKPVAQLRIKKACLIFIKQAKKVAEKGGVYPWPCFVGFYGIGSLFSH
jgi:hypothetical protein